MSARSRTRAAGPRTSTGRSTTCICCRDPSRMFNGNALATNFLRTNYPGMGSINKWIDQKDGDTVNNNTLRYNAMQMSVQRRLNRGPADGAGLHAGEGRGLDRLEPGHSRGRPDGRAEQAASSGGRRTTTGRTTWCQLQLHDPERAAEHAGAKWILGDWQVSGVTKYPERHGDAAHLHHQQHRASPTPTRRSRRARRRRASTPASRSSRSRGIRICPKRISCTSTRARSRWRSRSARRSATSATCRSASCGNPGWWNWDLTLARRFPVPQLGRNAQARAPAAALQHLQHGAVHHDEHGPAVPGRPDRARTGQPAADEHQSRPLHGGHPAAAVRHHGPLRLLTRRVRPTAHASSACAVGAFCFPPALPGRPERLAGLDELYRHFGTKP